MTDLMICRYCGGRFPEEDEDEGRCRLCVMMADYLRDCQRDSNPSSEAVNALTNAVERLEQTILWASGRA